MTLSEQMIIDQISADEFGSVNVRQRTDIVKDGDVVSTTYYRHVVGPNDDLKDEGERVQAIAKAARKGALPLPKVE